MGAVILGINISNFSMHYETRKPRLGGIKYTQQLSTDVFNIITFCMILPRKRDRQGNSSMIQNL
jgi:hypothetical protein